LARTDDEVLLSKILTSLNSQNPADLDVQKILSNAKKIRGVMNFYPDLLQTNRSFSMIHQYLLDPSLRGFCYLSFFKGKDARSSSHLKRLPRDCISYIGSFFSSVVQDRSSEINLKHITDAPKRSNGNSNNKS
jgi:hypothetical protein